MKSWIKSEFDLDELVGENFFRAEDGREHARIKKGLMVKFFKIDF